MPSQSTKTWGLVLSGGAAWGLANAGVLEVLEQKKLMPDSIAGSSMGAIVAGLFALFSDTKALGELTKNLRLRNIATLSKHPFRGGLHGGLFQQRLEKHLKRLVGDARIDDCRIPFACVTGRVKEPIRWRRCLRKNFAEEFLRSVEFFVFPQETRLLDALMASSAVPVIFSPHRMGEETFIDLVDFGAIPSRILRKLQNPDIIIATNTVPRYPLLEPWIPALQAAHRAVEESCHEADLVITPVAAASPWRFDRGTDFWNAGKRAVEEALPGMRKLLK